VEANIDEADIGRIEEGQKVLQIKHKIERKIVASRVYGELLLNRPKILSVHLSHLKIVIPIDLCLKLRCES
jgi:hypothetical protein